MLIPKVPASTVPLAVPRGSMELEAPFSLDGPERLSKGAKGRSKSPESGPTPGGNSIKIEVKEASMNKDPGSAGSFAHSSLQVVVHVLLC